MVVYTTDMKGPKEAVGLQNMKKGQPETGDNKNMAFDFDDEEEDRFSNYTTSTTTHVESTIPSVPPSVYSLPITQPTDNPNPHVNIDTKVLGVLLVFGSRIAEIYLLL